MGLVSQLITALKRPPHVSPSLSPDAGAPVPFVAATVRVRSPWGALADYHVCHGWNDLRCASTGKIFRYHHGGWCSQAAG